MSLVAHPSELFSLLLLLLLGTRDVGFYLKINHFTFKVIEISRETFGFIVLLYWFELSFDTLTKIPIDFS